MTKTIRAIFDGQALRPTSALDLEPNASYLISIEVPASRPRESTNAWDELEAFAGSVEAPRDWSREHDHYLHGTPKRDR